MFGHFFFSFFAYFYSLTPLTYNFERLWTKNRRAGFQPIPGDLVLRLHRFADSGEPKQLYDKAYSRGSSKRQPPISPLLYVPSSPARSLYRDLEAAGIPRITPKGKLDFHACRGAYINLLLESGDITPKEVQELARHSTLDLTMNVYVRVREERLSDSVDGSETE